ncbi:MAG: tyrosine recombinase XerC [Planctomycetota bacterium]
MDEIDLYLASMRDGQRVSPHTLRAYGTDLVMFFEWLSADKGDPGLKSIEAHHLREYLGELRRADRARATIARKAAALRGFFGFLHREGRLSGNPAALLRSSAGPRKLPAALSEEQLQNLLSAPQGNNFIDLRDRALLEFLYSTGARVGEVCALSVEQIDLAEGVVRLFGKGKKERLALIGRYAKEALAAYLDIRRGRRQDGIGEPLFLNHRGGALSDRSVRRILKKRLMQAGLPSSVSPHTLRHSFATHLLRHGAGLRSVQELLGHESVNTTQIYTKITPEHLAEIYKRAHPRTRLDQDESDRNLESGADN